MIIQENLTIQEKLKILTDAAKYDVACTSSGVQRRGKKGHLGNSSEAGICHSFAADGRCARDFRIDGITGTEMKFEQLPLFRGRNTDTCITNNHLPKIIHIRDRDTDLAIFCCIFQ